MEEEGEKMEWIAEMERGEGKGGLNGGNNRDLLVVIIYLLLTRSTQSIN